MSTPALPEETVTALSEGQRLLYTFTAPSKTMSDLRRNASWWVPWLLISLVSIAFSYTLDKKIGWGQAMETAIQSSPRAVEKMDKYSPAQREKLTQAQETFARIKGYATPISTLLLLVAVAGALLGLFNFGFGAKLSFGELMGVTAYSFLPSIFYTLLLILLLFLVQPEAFNIQSPAATNLGYFIPPSSPFLKILLEVFDVFALWQVFLLAIGVSQLSKVKKSTAFAAIFSAYFIFYLILAGVVTLI